MRILRWRLKLTEFDYEIVYKVEKINVNADALSRNPINLKKTSCYIINHKKFLNPDNPDAVIISKMLEESDEDEEDEDFSLNLSHNDETEELLPDKSFEENTDFTQEELCESPKVEIIEKVLIHGPPEYSRV